MIARFQAECGVCIGDIDEGVTDVVYDTSLGWIHSDPDECEESHDDAG